MGAVERNDARHSSFSRPPVVTLRLTTLLGQQESASLLGNQDDSPPLSLASVVSPNHAPLPLFCNSQEELVCLLTRLRLCWRGHRNRSPVGKASDRTASLVFVG